VRDFGASCLLYPRKGKAIGEIVGWFDKEIKSLTDTFTKVNRNFVCYGVVGVLRIFYNNGCDHVAELQDIMSLCDARILEDLPPELSKLTSRLVKKWWTEHKLPNAATRLCKDQAVSSFSMSIDFSCYCVFNLYLLGFFMQSDGDGGDGNGEHDDQPKGAHLGCCSQYHRGAWGCCRS
jgi:hypothetical protein